MDRSCVDAAVVVGREATPAWTCAEALREQARALLSEAGVRGLDTRER
jgi:hypothetical protein